MSKSSNHFGAPAVLSLCTVFSFPAPTFADPSWDWRFSIQQDESAIYHVLRVIPGSAIVSESTSDIYTDRDYLVAAGSDASFGCGSNSPAIAIWNGWKWIDWPNSMHGVDNSSFNSQPIIEDLVVFDGRLFACGTFDTIGSTAADGIAYWDPEADSGSGAWVAAHAGISAFGTPLQWTYYSFAIHDGELYIGGTVEYQGDIACDGSPCLARVYEMTSLGTWAQFGEPMFHWVNKLYSDGTSLFATGSLLQDITEEFLPSNIVILSPSASDPFPCGFPDTPFYEAGLDFLLWSGDYYSAKSHGIDLDPPFSCHGVLEIFDPPECTGSATAGIVCDEGTGIESLYVSDFGTQFSRLWCGGLVGGNTIQFSSPPTNSVVAVFDGTSWLRFSLTELYADGVHDFVEYRNFMYAAGAFSLVDSVIVDAGIARYGEVCVADTTGSSDTNSAEYGIPDGAVDTSDYFFYLDRFGDGHCSADLTGSSDQNDPSYGVPDGDIDADDHFYYLDQFSAGCN